MNNTPEIEAKDETPLSKARLIADTGNTIAKFVVLILGAAGAAWGFLRPYLADPAQFGERQDRRGNFPYTAATDGFVTGLFQPKISTHGMNFYVFRDGQKIELAANFGPGCSITFPVRAGEKWQLDVGEGKSEVYWTPLNRSSFAIHPLLGALIGALLGSAVAITLLLLTRLSPRLLNRERNSSAYKDT